MTLALNYTSHLKKTIELIFTSLATNIMPKTSYRFIEPQNAPTPCEHVVQSPHLF
jgi:hypothetical protein